MFQAGHLIILNSTSFGGRLTKTR